jgi:hypothetical protein
VTVGQRFAEALAAKDAEGMRAVLADDVDIRAMTPGRFWEPGSVDEFVDEVVLRKWFSDKDHILGIESIESATVGDRHRVAYIVKVENGDGLHLVEQQAYYDLDATADRIGLLRIMCSGYRPVDA